MSDLVVMHPLSIARCLEKDSVTLNRENVGLLIERTRKFCKQTLNANEGLVLDFDGVLGIFADAAEDFARFVRSFRNGSLDLNSTGRDEAPYLIFQRLLTGSTRQGVDLALRQASAGKPDKLTVVAPTTDHPSDADALLHDHVVGPFQSIRKARSTFFLLWNTETWLAPGEIIEQMTDPRQKRQVYADLNLLAGRGLIARKPGSGASYLYAPIR